MDYDDRFYYGVSPAFWSIAVEVQLYLLYPVLLWLVARMGWQRTLVYIAILEIGLRTISSAILIFVSRSLRQIGLWSYSIYLLHQPLLVLAPRIAAKLAVPDLSQSVLIFMLSLCLWFPIVGISALWYRSIELPMITIGQQQVRKIS
jgi:peptidoglycan/LPS O-acetylase OafA/YrhL